MRVGLLRYYRDPHKGLFALSQAAKLSDCWKVMRLPMPVRPVPQWIGRNSIGAKLWRYFYLMLGHIDLPWRIRHCSREKVLVREFLVLPLLLVAPLLWTQRRRCWFLLQHSLQTALFRRSDRLAFRILAGMGFGFVVYEDRNTWFKCISRRRARVRDIPLPVVIRKQWESGKSKKRVMQLPVIGVVGNFRLEKSPDVAIRSLINDNTNAALYKIVVGCPDPGIRAQWSSFTETVDTSRDCDYLETISRCDVLVFTYRKDAYEYRTSGVIAEAIAVGARVVAPNFPVIRHQIDWPAPIGLTFDHESEIGKTVLRLLQTPADDWWHARSLHLQKRGVEALVARFRQWSDDVA